MMAILSFSSCILVRLKRRADISCELRTSLSSATILLFVYS